VRVRRLVGALVAGILLAPPVAAAMPHDPVPAPAVPIPRFDPADAPPRTPAVHWRPSRALGSPAAGRLVDGVQLPDEGRDFFTWDPVNLMSPNREWRRWGTARLIRTLFRVISEYRAAHPWAPRVGIGDLSRPHGGPFGAQYGGLGHASHQNGLDADVYYPRLDALEEEADRPELVDQHLAQDLVDRFVAAGARYVFTGPHLSLHGPRRIVQTLAFHDDHLHVRLR
jgi:murein endopeptidase